MERRGFLDIGQLYGIGREEMKRYPIYCLTIQNFSFESAYQPI
jgi:hypothetical protein